MAAMISMREVSAASAAAAVQASSCALSPSCGLTVCCATSTESKPSRSASSTSARLRRQEAS